MKILIIGLGSIAKKHIHVLKELVNNVEFYALRSSKNGEDTEGVTNLYSWSEISKYKFYFVIISSPSNKHLNDINKLASLKIPMMVEKPLFTDFEQINIFQNNPEVIDSLIYVACNFRFHPLIDYLKKYLANNPGQINEVNSYFGSYLPDWRPSVDYRKVYSAKKELGGGVHLDLIHEPDYLMYLFGKPKRVQSNHRKVSSLEIDTYDSSNYLFQYDQFQAQISLNYYRRDPKRTLEIIRESETLLVDFIEGTLLNKTSKEKIFEIEEKSIYTPYKKQMEYFLTCVEKNYVPMNSAKEAIEILKCVL